MKKLMAFISLMALVTPSLWANTDSLKNEEELEPIHPRTWVVAMAPWPDLNVFVSKDFFAAKSDLGFSTTSLVNLEESQEFWSKDNESQYNYIPLTFQQTGNLDLKFGWFHFQFLLGPAYSINLVENDGSHYWKGSLGFVFGTNLIFSERAVVSLQVRTMQMNSQTFVGTGGLYLGWRF